MKNFFNRFCAGAALLAALPLFTTTRSFCAEQDAACLTFEEYRKQLAQTDPVIEPQKPEQPAPKTEFKVRLAGPANVVLKKLGLDPAHPEKQRKIYFFDTPDRACLGQGVVLRLSLSRNRAETTVKFSPAPAAMPVELLEAKDFKVEFDSAPGMKKLTTSLGLKITEQSAAKALSGDPAQAFSPLQRKMPAMLGRKKIPWNKLEPVGPAYSSTWKTGCATLPETTIEMWLYNEAQYFEISVRTGPDPETVKRDTAALLQCLKARDIRSAPDQTGKTSFVLHARR
ncbi:MAG: hypothetical protein PHW69_09760 [Elusimicrobiaceae bacterium]|nr:hypothetical protein [Elusimicrobiaceae bacterium]